MHHLFISYSRHDRAFVERLSEHLSKAGKDTWVDWEDIPPTATFMEEIARAIEAADSFIFIISPDSCVSTVCRQEIEHAAHNNKRLIPILCRPTPSDSVPAAVAALNWIRFDAINDFDDGLALLNVAIDTDYDWVRSHTEILVRASEWEQRKRTRSALLRGSELASAEHLFADNAAKQPQATPLQREFLVASRQNATRTLRIIVGAVCVALVITSVLAMVAVRFSQIAETHRLEAERQQHLAEERARVANSERLAAESRDHLGTQLDLAMLLSVEAYHTNQTPEAANSMLYSLQQSPYLRRYLHGHTGKVGSVAFHPNGRILASGGKNEVIIWDLDTTKPLLQISTTFSPRRLAFSPDGSVLGGDNVREAFFWDARSGRELGEVEGSFEGFLGNGRARILVGPPRDRHTLFTVDPRKHLSIDPYTDDHLKYRFVRFPFGDDFYTVAMSRDGKLLATERHGGVEVWDTVTGRPLYPEATCANANSPLGALAFDSKKRFLLCGGDEHFTFVDVTSGEAGDTLPIQGYVHALAVSDDGEMIASTGSDKQIFLWNASTREQVGTSLAGHLADVSGIAFSPDGKTLASASDDGEVILWDAIASQPAQQTLGGYRIRSGIYSFASQAGTPAQAPESDAAFEALLRAFDSRDALFQRLATAMQFGPNGTTLAVVSGDGSLQLSNVIQRRPISQIHHAFAWSPHVMALSPIANIVAASGTPAKGYVGQYNVDIVDTATGRHLLTPKQSDTLLGDAMAFSPDGRLLAVAGHHDLQFLDVTSQQTVQVIENVGLQFVDAVDFEPGGQRILIAGIANYPSNPTYETWEWDIAANKRTHVLSSGSQTTAISFSPDGGILALGTADGNVTTMRTVSFEALTIPFRADNGRIDILQFSRDSKLLAIGGEQRAQLWDVENQRRVGDALYGPVFSEDGVSTVDKLGAMVFSEDHKALLAAYPLSQTVASWTVDPQDWIRYICTVANRNMSLVEWAQFMKAEPYRETCPGLQRGHDFHNR